MTTPSTPPDINHYLERGLVLAPEEYDMTALGLVILSKVYAGGDLRKGIMQRLAESPQDPYTSKRCMDLTERLSHVQLAGKGTGTLMEAFATEMAQAHEQAKLQNDSAPIERTMVKYLEMLIRVEPDPARKCGKMLFQMACSQQAKAEAGRIGPPILKGLFEKYVRLQAEYAHAGDADAAQWLKFVCDDLSHGIKRLEAGKEPWAEEAVPS